MSTPLRQVFTGGTGRSGTTILGELLGHHPKIWMTQPIEIRLLTDADGLLDLALHVRPASWHDWRGYLDRRRRTRLFIEKMQKKWWYRIGPDGTPRGLHLGLRETDVEQAMRNFERFGRFNQRCQRLVSDLLDPVAIRHGASMWVDTDPPNAMNAHRILRLLPDARVIQVVRDGRDSAASVLKQHWGPNDPMQALDWWRYRMLRSHNGISKAPADRVITIRLEDLPIHDRQGTYASLLKFLSIDDAPQMRSFFDTTMTAANGNPGRWAADIPADQRTAFADRYEEIWHELHGRGLTLSPL